MVPESIHVPKPLLVTPKLVALPLEMAPLIVLLPVFAPDRVRVTEAMVVPDEMPPPNTRILEAVVLAFVKV